MVISNVCIMFQLLRTSFCILYLFKVVEGGLHYFSNFRKERFCCSGALCDLSKFIWVVGPKIQISVPTKSCPLPHVLLYIIANKWYALEHRVFKDYLHLT